ncbi:flagellar biosynthesis anti-sigma factor FlgM [Marinimicrobium sp. ARAG 43.8]|uniref:flagellar biosynthesis anti-sigma factor FlgM n=1 Tax=Marinimicrobium sp. ARAG 43.8 TaxID=3418719 RepID=UPI003CF9175B
MVIDSGNSIKPGNGGNNRSAGIPATENRSKTGDAQQSARAPQGDQVQLSAEAQSINRLEDQLSKLPEVDIERVASLKQAIAEGRFEINAERIAQNMLQQDDLLGE